MEFHEFKDVLIYNRVSTDDKGQDKESNIVSCKAYCKSKGYRIIDIILDEGITGDSYYYNRDKGKLIDDYIKKYNDMNKPLGIIVFAMDRFTRQKPYLSMSLLMKLHEKNIHLNSVSESVFNFSNDYSDFIWYAILWGNNYFLKQLSNKIKAGNEKRRSEGKATGRKRKANYELIYDTYKNKKPKGRAWGLRELARYFKVNPSAVSSAIKYKGLDYNTWYKKFGDKKK